MERKNSLSPFYCVGLLWATSVWWVETEETVKGWDLSLCLCIWLFTCLYLCFCFPEVATAVGWTEPKQTVQGWCLNLESLQPLSIYHSWFFKQEIRKIWSLPTIQSWTGRVYFVIVMIQHWSLHIVSTHWQTVVIADMSSSISTVLEKKVNKKSNQICIGIDWVHWKMCCQWNFSPYFLFILVQHWGGRVKRGDR